MDFHGRGMGFDDFPHQDPTGDCENKHDMENAVADDGKPNKEVGGAPWFVSSNDFFETEAGRELWASGSCRLGVQKGPLVRTFSLIGAKG